MEAKNIFVFPNIKKCGADYDEKGKIIFEPFKCKVYQCQNRLFTKLSEYKATETIYYENLICSSCIGKYKKENTNFSMEKLFEEKVVRSKPNEKIEKEHKKFIEMIFEFNEFLDSLEDNYKIIINEENVYIYDIEFSAKKIEQEFNKAYIEMMESYKF